MKIAMLQCNSTTGDIVGNARRIATAVRSVAHDGVDLCVTPESALCGVGARALLLADGFLDACSMALRDLAQELAGGPAVLLGAPVANEGRRVSNAAVLIHNGAYTVVARKSFSGGDISDDARYYEPGTACGLVSLGGWRFGVVLCEDTGRDMAFGAHPSASLKEFLSRGVDCIVHMTAWPLVLETQAARERIFSHTAARHHIHIFSINAVGGNDDAVYAGQSTAFGPTGALLARGRAFAEDTVLVDTATPSRLAQPCLCACVEEECWRAVALGTGDFVRKSGVHSVRIGLSGGLDSALVAAVAVQALGSARVRGVFLPSPYTSEDSYDYVRVLTKNLGIACDSINITPMMQAVDTALGPLLDGIPAKENDATAENMQARLRGLALMAVTNREGSVLLGTGNKSEAAMGYCTLYGDAIGALSVLGDMPKTLVVRVARWYNGQYPDAAIPEGIISREPTAELKPGQRDVDSLPPYSALDTALDGVLGHFASGVAMPPPDGDGESAALAREVFDRLRRSEFKRRQMPPVVRLTDKSLWGKSLWGDWQLPLVSTWHLPGGDP